MLTGKNKTLVYDSQKQALPRECKEHYLLLLELYVKQISGDRLTKLNQMFFLPTSVHFGFLDFVNENDLMVTPVDPLFQPQVGVVNEAEVFNVGKSVLFAIDSEAVMNRMIKMILKFTVKKPMPDAIKPDVLVGTGELDLSDQYAALRIEMMQNWKNNITIFKEFDGQVPLIYNGSLSGNLDIFVRISSLGQIIVTEFDAPITQDPSTFVFGTREPGTTDRILLYKCREVDSRTIDIFKDSSEDLQKPITCPVCVPEKFPCVPCGKLAAVEEKEEKIRKKRDVGIAEKKLKDKLSKYPVQYNPSEPCGKPVVLKVSGLFDNGDNIGRKKPTVTVAAESAATKPGDPSDPDHDIFVLRIGKKGLVGVGEKSDIQLEMKTPKGPPINIYQDTPTESCACIHNGSQIFKKGKSCLFALPDNILQKPLCNFPITMSVYKELPPGVLPDVMLIGTHQIQLHDLMNSLLSMHASQHGNPYKTMKNTFKITTATGQHVGEVTVFIRVSCFGKKIVTQFQLPCNKESYLFKGVNDSPVYLCKRVVSALDRRQIKCVCSSKNSDGSGEAARIRYSTSTDERQRKQLEDIKKDKCLSCCRGRRDIIKSKEIVRKCGCAVKAERTCSCTRTNIKYST